MDVLAQGRPRLFTYLAVCGIAMALGWGIRGQFGHENGAMIPGILGALAIALVSPDGRRRNRVAALGVAGGLGMAVGGVMSYGGLVLDLSQSATAVRAVLALAAKGAIWGGIAGGAIGMALSRTRYRRLDLLWLAPVVAFWWVTGNRPEFDSLSEGDMSLELALTLAAFLIWLATVKRDRAATFVSVCLMIGFGVGCPLGFGLMALFSPTEIPIDWWKVAELVWGLCGGLALGVAAYVLDEDWSRPAEVAWGWTTWLGLVFLVWWAPFRNGYNTMTYWAYEQDAVPDTAVTHYVVAVLVVLFVLVAAIDLVRRTPGPRTVTVLVFLWVLWSTFAFQFLKTWYPSHTESNNWTQLTFVLCGIALSAYATARWRWPRTVCPYSQGSSRQR